MDLLESLLKSRNHFELFSLPVRFSLDRQLLHTHYLELIRATHPDFAGTDADDQIRAMELSARVNEAFATLDDDLTRAEYLLHVRGGNSNEARLSQATLEMVFDLREALDETKRNADHPAEQQIRRRANAWLGELIGQIGLRLDLPESAPLDPMVREWVATAKYVKKVCE